ncbi:MAG TPA: DUF4840 domain-containing protein [Bacteroides sp.]|nr:DUF4840 domain-containing protein [Phocaeicola coprophilus]HBB07589.1 DUF4840 domain-containing protein [Bacteroides sp.]
MGCTLGFASCDNDDTAAPPTIVSTQSMYGDYTGVMTSLTIVPYEEESTDTPEGTAITATVDNDTIYLTDFPIKDIVLSIVGDETTADQIVEAVGQVDYKIGYTPTLSAAKDSILFTLDPKPLKLSVNIPGTEEGESLPTAIEIKVQAAEGANYEGKTTALKFGFQASEVLIGEDQTPLEGFTPTTFDFTTVKSRK